MDVISLLHFQCHYFKQSSTIIKKYSIFNPIFSLRAINLLSKLVEQTWMYVRPNLTNLDVCET